MSDRKIYFSGISGIGDLAIKEIFFEFEGIPVLFTCTDKKGILYLCLCNEIRKTQNWIVAETSNQIIADMVADKITIYEAFRKSEGEKFKVYYDKYNGLRFRITEFGDISDEDLPDKNEYLEVGD